MASLPEQEGPPPSGLLAELLDAEAVNERELAAARAEAARIVERARDRERAEDDALARELDELRRSVRGRLEAARQAELEALAAEGRARAAALGQLAEESADALAAAVVDRLVKEAAPP